MSWVQMNIDSQWFDINGDPASGYVIKAYESGTLTNALMAITSAGGSQQATVTLNAEGKPEVSGNEVTLFIDRDYKYAIFESQSDADANSNPFAGFYDGIPYSYGLKSDDIYNTETGQTITQSINGVESSASVYYDGPSRNITNADHNTIIEVMPMVITEVTPEFTSGVTRFKCVDHGLSDGDTIQLKGTFTGITGATLDTDLTVLSAIDSDYFTITLATSGTFTSDGLAGLDVDRTFTIVGGTITVTAGLEVNFVLNYDLSRSMTFVATGAATLATNTTPVAITAGKPFLLKQRVDSDQALIDSYMPIGCF